MTRASRIGRAAAALSVVAGVACSNPDDRVAADSSNRGPIDTVRVVFEADSAAGSASPPPRVPVTGDSAEAVDVVARYYRNLDTKNFRGAYDLLEETPDRPTYEQFVAQHQGVSRVRVMPGDPGRIEGAAGARSIQVPVVVAVNSSDGTRQKLEGNLILRQSVVDRASAVQRRWRISSLRVAPAR
jgi:hypothetical protein